ncbi:choice-of-anchor Q domain-containing protein [Protaetiibacter larvae]|uniref:Right handed beta helix domain-containing protein n=1 Tax=Protaetiibacter larvae TaxID=2592654 RepID=A0A5C1Y7A3_9MICO|nr:choice-of-anchor Q domain-containing protein [Protaetiibacter larvae]QEO09318.1 hypothetical protein FLP23_04400 [Protaetiibacter larvae]
MPHAPSRNLRPALFALTALALGVSLATAGLLVAPQPARAASFTVTTTADVVDTAGGCAGATLATLPGTGGLVSLREAVCAANNAAGPDVISLPAGTYVLTGASGEDYAASGDLDVWDSGAAGDGLSIVGAGSDRTIIDGDENDRLFDVYNRNAFAFALDDVTLSYGRVPSNDAGGALLTGFGSTTQLTRVVVEWSRAGNGGGIANIQGDLVLLDTVVHDNYADEAGGGVFSTAGLFQMQRSTVNNNVADTGGALWLSYDGPQAMTIEQSTIHSNAGGGAAGIYVPDTSHGMLTITDTTITDNRSATAGGAVVVAANSWTELMLSSSTVTGNVGPTGGGVIGGLGLVTVQNSIVAQNTGGDLVGTISGSYNYVGVAGAGIVDGVANNRAGTVSAPLDPQLREIGSYGGPTRTRVPLPGSPVVDTGSLCGAVDQRQVARSVCDVGAVELSAAPDTALGSAPAASTSETSATLAFTGSGGSGTLSFECALDAAAYTPCTSPTTLGALASGAHTFRVRAVDALGATDPSSATAGWTVIGAAAPELADSGAAETGTLLAAGLVLLAAGGVLLGTRLRTRLRTRRS